ncbi:unnamed protein product [Closterium sp. NIES-54]
MQTIASHNTYLLLELLLPIGTITAATATAATTATTAILSAAQLWLRFGFSRLIMRADHASLFDLASGAATAPPATADSLTRSQWLTRDAAACLAIRNHLPLAECAHFGQHRTAQALYDAVVARYSSPATAALGRLILPYLFPELSALTTVENLVSHLRVSDARYRAAVPAEFLDRNPPPMYITLYFIVTRLPDSPPFVPRVDTSSACRAPCPSRLIPPDLVVTVPSSSLVDVVACHGRDRTRQASLA